MRPGAGPRFTFSKRIIFIALLILSGLLYPATIFPVHAAVIITPPLHVSGNRLVDASNNTVRLVGLNYGDHPKNTPTFSTGNLSTDAANIKVAGFNAVNLIEEWGNLETSATASSFTYNSTSLRILANRLGNLTAQNLFVTIKLHADADTAWAYNNLNAFLGPTKWCGYSQGQFATHMSDSFYATSKSANASDGIAHLTNLWIQISNTVKNAPNNQYVLGYDLLNEPYNLTTTQCPNTMTSTQIAASWHNRTSEMISAIRANNDNRVITVELAPFFHYYQIYQSFTPWSDSNIMVSYHWYADECLKNNDPGCPSPTSNPGGSWFACTSNSTSLSGLWGNVKASQNTTDITLPSPNLIPKFCHNTPHYIAQLQAAHPTTAISIGEFGDIFDNNTSGDVSHPWNLYSIGVFVSNSATSYYYYASGTCQSPSSPCTWTPQDLDTPVWPGGSSLSSTSTGSTAVSLHWSYATDLAGVANYQIYKNTILVATVGNITTYTVTNLTPGTSYTFQVQAGNAKGYYSITGPSLTVTTSSAVLQGPIAFVTDVPVAGANSNTATTGSMTFSSGDLIAVYVTVGAGQTVSSVADSGSPSSTYTLRVSAINGNTITYLYTATAATSTSNTITVTISSSGNLAIGAAEYSGVAGFGASNTSTGTSTAPSISLTTQNASSWVLVSYGWTGSGVHSGDTGFTDRHASNPTGNLALDYGDTNSPEPVGTYTYSATLSQSNAWAMVALELVTAKPPILFVANVPVTGANSNSATTSSLLFTKGDLIVVYVTVGAAQMVTSITDSGSPSSTYTLRASAINGNTITYLYTATAATSTSNTITVTISASGNLAISAVEYSGAVVFGALSISTGTSTAPSMSLTTESSSSWVLVSYGWTGAGTHSGDTGFTDRHAGSTGNQHLDYGDTNAAEPAGTYTYSATISESDPWTMIALELV